MLMEKNIKFRMLRLKSGLTQKEIELKSGIYASKISYFENYQAKPSEEEAEKLANALGCTRKEIALCFNVAFKSTYGHKRGLKHKTL